MVRMANSLRAIAVTLFALALVPCAESAEKFEKLTGAQVLAKLAGMEISDEVHWGDVFERNGALTSYSMGRKSVGKWRVLKDQLCIDRGREEGGCYQGLAVGRKGGVAA